MIYNSIKVTLSLFLFIIFTITAAQAETPNAKVKVGVILPLSGPFTRYGLKIQEAISSLANDQISFVFEDEGCDPKIAVSAFKKLSEIDGINLFLGPWCGSPQSAVAPLLKKDQQLAILGSSAPEAVFSSSGGRMFSSQHSIEAESNFLGSKLNEQGVTSVVIIFKENAFSRAHEAAFRSSFKGKILSTYAYSSDDISELKSIALKVKQLQPDALYVPDAFPLMAGLVKELKTIGVQKKIYSVYSSQSDDVLKMLGADGEGLIYSYPDIGDQEALHYFPLLATKMLVEAVKNCGDNASCVKDRIEKQHSFDTHGVLSGKLILKTIRDGKYDKLILTNNHPK